jgi:hypothetical protein
MIVNGEAPNKRRCPHCGAKMTISLDGAKCHAYGGVFDPQTLTRRS